MVIRGRTSLPIAIAKCHPMLTRVFETISKRPQETNVQAQTVPIRPPSIGSYVDWIPSKLAHSNGMDAIGVRPGNVAQGEHAPPDVRRRSHPRGKQARCRSFLGSIPREIRVRHQTSSNQGLPGHKRQVRAMHQVQRRICHDDRIRPAHRREVRGDMVKASIPR